MITNKFTLITEDPDTILLNDDDTISWGDSDAMPFGVRTNFYRTKIVTLVIGDNGSTHEDNGIGKGWKFPGRIWLDKKMISFWVYPDENLFKQIIERLESELDIKIFNNDWHVEVIEREGSIVKADFSEYRDDFYWDERGYGDESKIIPVEEYVGSEDFSDLQKQMHLMNWKEKQKLKERGIKLAPGFGSDRIAWDKPRNLKYRQNIYQEKKSEK